jgi:TRAP-type C4-dicarboxylate transport system permease large subunit
VHFAIIMSVNLTVGLATPPMGLVLFVPSSVSGERSRRSPRRSCRSSVQVVVIFLITYRASAISLFMPQLFGFARMV